MQGDQTFMEFAAALNSVSQAAATAKTSLSREQRFQLKAIFTYLDTDMDSRLSAAEAQHAARLIGACLTPFQAVPSEETVDLEAFYRLMEQAEQYDAVGSKTPFNLAVSKMYRCLDTRGQGYATRDQLMRFFRMAGDNIKPTLTAALIDAMDQSLSGESFTEEELRQFLRKRAERGDFIY